MKNLLLLFSLLSLFTACRGSFISNVKPEYQTPKDGEIALMYLDHADIEISNQATKAFEEQLAKCGHVKFTKSTKTDSLLQVNNIIVPRRLNDIFFQSIKNIIPSKFLMTGAVNEWHKSGGLMNLFGNNNRNINISITLYEIETGKVVWSATGEDNKGGKNSEPESIANSILWRLLREWRGFCR